MATFPGTGNSLGVKVELLSIVSAGVWTDISQYVLWRNNVQITGVGRADWTSTLQAAQLTLSLRNDGRFTPKLAAGAYFPNITRNTQIRVSVNATSVTSVAYSGFRFWGEVSEWPPQWDASGREVHCDITASGIWRRMSQLATTLGSAFTRYNSITLTGTSQPRAYWPMEDGTGSGQLVSFDSTAGTANAVQSFTTGQAGPVAGRVHRLQGQRRDPAAQRREDHRHRPRRRHRHEQLHPVPDLRPGRRGLRQRHHQLEPRRDRQRGHHRQVRGVP